MAHSDQTPRSAASDLGLHWLPGCLSQYLRLLGYHIYSSSFSGPFTLFGPTDAAFKALPKKFVDFLLKNTTVLTAILKYHVAAGKAMSKDLTNDQLVPSLQGKAIRINIYKDGSVRLLYLQCTVDSRYLNFAYLE